MSQINPTGDRVIVRAISETQTAGGIFIPENAAEKSSVGIIVAVGQGKVLENGNRQSMHLKVGDKVLFGKYAGTEIKVDGEDLMVMREDDVIAVFENSSQNQTA